MDAKNVCLSGRTGLSRERVKKALLTQTALFGPSLHHVGLPERDDARAQGRLAGCHFHFDLVVHLGLFLDDKHDDRKAQRAVIAERALANRKHVVRGVATDLPEPRARGGLHNLRQVNVSGKRTVGADALQRELSGAVPYVEFANDHSAVGRPDRELLPPVSGYPGVAKIIGVGFRQYSTVGEANEEQFKVGVVLDHVARVLVRIAPGQREFLVRRHAIADDPRSAFTGAAQRRLPRVALAGAEFRHGGQGGASEQAGDRKRRNSCSHGSSRPSAEPKQAVVG
jgi:hypothetical protein